LKTSQGWTQDACWNAIQARHFAEASYNIFAIIALSRCIIGFPQVCTRDLGEAVAAPADRTDREEGGALE
jgi:hypothetical protein